MSDYLRLVPTWHAGPIHVLHATRVFTLGERWCSSPVTATKAGMYSVLQARDWVNVVALTARREVVMIEQYRAGLHAVTLELPGGIVDDGESATDAATRELLEETGYAGGPATLLGRVSANPAIMNNWASTVLIESCGLVQPQRLDGNEEIAVRLVPVSEVAMLIRRGLVHHSLVVAALHHATLHGVLPQPSATMS